MNRVLTRALAGACALTLLLGACSDDDGDDDADATTTEASDDSTTTAGDDAPTTTADGDDGDDGGDDVAEDEAEALAESINLTVSDFSPEWSAEEGDDDGGSQIDECFVEVVIDDVAVAEAETPAFSLQAEDGTGQYVSMQTVVFPSATEAEALLAEAGSPAFATCVTDSLATALGADPGAGLEAQVDDPAVTEESLGVIGEVSIPIEGTPQPGLVDVHLFRTAEVVSFVATLDVGATGFFEDTLTDLYTVIADRHASEIG